MIWMAVSQNQGRGQNRTLFRPIETVRNCPFLYEERKIAVFREPCVPSKCG
jgi:hypothetical protein